MKLLVSFWVALAIISAFLCPPSADASTGVGEWHGFGPTGAYVSALERDPSDDRVVYAGVNNAGAFKSTNGGESWSSMSGLPATVLAIEFDPADGDSIFIGAANGLYNSHDAGETWTSASSELMAQFVHSFVIPVSAELNMLAGTRNGVFRSTDGGETWVPANTGLDGTIILALRADPSRPDIIYAGTLSYGIYKTIDGGANWAAIGNGLSGGAVYCIVVDPEEPDRVYAGTWNGGVVVTVDGGANWTTAGNELAGNYVPDLLIDPDPPYTIHAGTQGGLWTSSDRGATWKEQTIDQPFDIVSAISLGTSGDAGTLVGTQGAGVFRSTDGGLIWRASSDGLIGCRVVALEVSEAQPATIYAGALGGGVYRSDNRGRSWTRASSGLTNGSVYALAADPFTPGTLYAGSGAGAFKTTDEGFSWVEVNNGFNPISTVNAISVGGLSPGTILAATDQGVFRSTDGADSWTASSSGLSDLRVTEVAFSPADSRRVYAGTSEEGVFRSDDGGQSWIAASAGLDSGEVAAVAADPLVTDTAYVAVGNRIFKTIDGGGYWSRVGSAPATWNYYCLVFDPTDPGVLYAGNDRVIRSGDSGETWTTMGNVGGYPWITALAVDPVDGYTLYAGSHGKGTQVLTLPGRPLWVPVVTHAPGLNDSSWRSDVWILNPTDEATTVALRFHGVGGTIEDSQVAPANSQLVLSDVVDLLGGNGSGALEVVSDSYVFAGSRTYNVSGGGTFGQSYPATDITQAMLQGESAVLPQLAEAVDFRTNIGVVNIGQEPAVVNLELFDGLGAPLANLAIPLQPGEWRLAVRPYFEEAGMTDLVNGWARVRVKEGGGIVALASVVDNTSGDPTSILMDRPPASSDDGIWVPVVTHVPGLHQSVWRSDVALLNTGQQSASITLRFHGSDGIVMLQDTLGSGMQEILGDVVALLGVEGSGALDVVGSEPTVVSSRTFNQSSDGTFGQSYPGVRPEVALQADESGYLLGLSENADFRTNIGFANLSNSAAIVGLELFTGAGEMEAQYSVQLEPGEWRLEVRPFHGVAGLSDLDQGFARVTMQSGGVVAAIASVVDNRTNDPTTVTLVR